MTKYSAQKLKSVSLNNGARRYAGPESLDSPKQMNTIEANMKPLISPVSEAGARPKPEPKPQQPVQQEPSFDWLSMFNRTFLSVYMEKEDALIGAGRFDYTFRVGNKRLYFLVDQVTVEVDSPNVSKTMLSKLRQQVATKVNKRFQQLNSRIDITNSEEDIATVHYIGLTSVMVIHQGEGFQIEHEYGSSFFQEECVFDLDDESKVLQLFSLNSFYNMVKLLQTPSDLLSYYDYHLKQIVEFNEFNGELELAEQFLNSASFFDRAVKVQQKLVEIGLLAKVETRLTDIVNNDGNYTAEQQQKKDELTGKLQTHANTFQKLLNGTTKRRHEADNILPLEQVRLLVDESMYTRLCIIEEMMAYENRSREECLQGYLSHQHSYNNFGHHYVIAVYGLAPDAEYSQQYIANNYQKILMDINAQLQDPAMKEYFILGFDMSKSDGKGNVTVQMDIFHQSGSVMTEVERKLYAQENFV